MSRADWSKVNGEWVRKTMTTTTTSASSRRSTRSKLHGSRSTNELIAAVRKATGVNLETVDVDEYHGFSERGDRAVDAAVAKGAITLSEARRLDDWAVEEGT